MVEYSYTDDGMPHLKEKGAFALPFASEEDIVNIFDIRGDGYDVTLSLSNGTISWVSVSGNKGGKGGLFRKKKGVAEETLKLTDILGVKIKRRRTSGQHEGEGMCLGFIIYSFEVFGPNSLRERIIELEHPSEKMCNKYCEKIMEYLDTTTKRPKTMKMFIQNYAGPHKSKEIYKKKVLPLFEAAHIEINLTEIQHNEQIKQEMIHLELDEFDCVACCGGDGTVNKLATALLNRVHALKKVDMKPGFNPIKSNLPLGIIPTGTTNQTAKTVLGFIDPVSAAINIILGRTAAVDMMSIFHKDKFLQWGFICQYGFAGNVLKIAKKYKRVGIGSKGLEAAVVKALSKSKLRMYDCDIEYLPANPLPEDQKYRACRIGCDVCGSSEPEQTEEETNDIVEECIVQPFNESNEVNDFQSLEDDDDKLQEEILEDNPWKASKGSYFHVGLYGIPGNSEVAPEGLSKFTHLNDGAMELVLVKECSRRDFIRFLKRHGNHKNQFEFPFVEIHRVKEIKFKPRFPMGWNYNDRTYNEVEDRMKSISHRMSVTGHKNEDSFIIDGENGSIHTPSPTGHAGSMENLDDLDDSDYDYDNNENGGSRVGSGKENNNFYKREDNVLVHTAPQVERLVGPQYRQTFADSEKWRRQKKSLRKEEKKQMKEESRMHSFWNIDNEICEDIMLNFRIHHGLITIFGTGMSPDTVFVTSPLSCLPVIPT